MQVVVKTPTTGSGKVTVYYAFPESNNATYALVDLRSGEVVGEAKAEKTRPLDKRVFLLVTLAKAVPLGGKTYTEGWVLKDFVYTPPAAKPASDPAPAQESGFLRRRYVNYAIGVCLLLLIGCGVWWHRTR